MNDGSPDLRQQAILAAAWHAFAAYGYRKTSMDDIAKGAGMSRPALYLHYRNKPDIFRTLVQSYYDQATVAVETALAGPGSLADVLAAAFHAQGGETFKAMLNSPHGMELLDATNMSATDIVLAGEERMRLIYATWLNRIAETGQGNLTGSAKDLAAMITAALKGIKMAATDFATYQTRVALLARTIGAGFESG